MELVSIRVSLETIAMCQPGLSENRKSSIRVPALLLLLSFGASKADTVDLAQWSAGGWRVTVDGVMGMLLCAHHSICAGETA